MALKYKCKACGDISKTRSTFLKHLDDRHPDIVSKMLITLKYELIKKGIDK